MTNIKSQTNGIIYHSGFKVISNENLGYKSVWIVSDSNDYQFTIHLIYEDENYISIEYNGIDRFTKLGLSRFERLTNKLKEFYQNRFHIENLEEPIFTDDQFKKLDEMLSNSNLD